METKQLCFLVIVALCLIPLAHGETPTGGTNALATAIQSVPRWAVLGFVEESNDDSSLTQEGQTLRKDLELWIQDQGIEVFNMSAQERAAWEILWMDPYKGRFPQEMLDGLPGKENVGLVSGSYDAGKPQDIKYILYIPSEKKTWIIYAGRPATKFSTAQPAVSDATKGTVEKTEVAKVDFLKRIKTPRQQPLQAETRRQRSMSQHATGNKRNVEKQLQTSEVLKDYVAPFKDKPVGVIQQEIAQCIESANSSYMSSSKMEMLSRAHALCSLLPDQAELQEELLAQLAEHQEFFQDRKERN